MPLTPRLVPPRDDPQGSFASVSRVLDTLSPPTNFAPSLAAIVQVSAGETRRLAPRAAGQNVVIPTADETNYGARIVLLIDGTLGACRVRPVSGTINGASAFTLSAGFVSSVELQSGGDGRWYAQRTNGAPFSAGAGLSESGGVLAVNGSTSITIASDEVRRAALTGEVTAGANDNATTVVRSTDFQASPWTGLHQFNADIRLGTLHTESNKSGALSITRTAGAMRIVVTSTGDITLGTISGCADGIPLIFEHVEASGAPNTLTVTNDTGSANAFACPGEVNLAIVGRGGFIAVGRQGANANWKIVATTN